MLTVGLKKNSAKKLSVTMASRFKIVDEEYIEELKDKSENETRRKVLEERFQKVSE